MLALAAAAELDFVSLPDALEIVLLLVDEPGPLIGPILVCGAGTRAKRPEPSGQPRGRVAPPAALAARLKLRESGNVPPVALTKGEILLELEAARADDAQAGTPARVRFAAVFDDLSFGECRHSRAEEALRAPRGMAAYNAGGKTVVLATKIVAPARKRAFVLLIFMEEQNVGAHQVLGGWRVFADEDTPLAELADNPSLALATLLDRYALVYEAGGIPSKFSALFLEPRTPDGSIQFLSTAAPTDRGAINAFVKPMAEHLEIAWPFVLDGNAYLADMRAR